MRCIFVLKRGLRVERVWSKFPLDSVGNFELWEILFIFKFQPLVARIDPYMLV